MAHGSFGTSQVEAVARAAKAKALEAEARSITRRAELAAGEAALRVSQVPCEPWPRTQKDTTMHATPGRALTVLSQLHRMLSSPSVSPFHPNSECTSPLPCIHPIPPHLHGSSHSPRPPHAAPPPVYPIRIQSCFDTRSYSGTPSAGRGRTQSKGVGDYRSGCQGGDAFCGRGGCGGGCGGGGCAGGKRCGGWRIVSGVNESEWTCKLN